MIVFVVGIYKSGTSMTTSFIEEMGIPSCVEEFRKSTSVIGTKQTYNILESYEVNLLNNDIIYSTDQNEINFDTDKMPENINDGLIDRIKKVYERVDYNCVIKDPRFIGTLKYWIQALGDKPYRIIYVHRNNTEDIVKSFKKDKWFNDKIKHSHEEVIENLKLNLTKKLNQGYKGLNLQYEFMRKYKNEVYTLIFNYITNSKNNPDYKKIYFTEYYQPSNEVKNLFSRQCPYNIPVWENIIAVDSQQEADYVIIQDKTKDKIENESKVIFFGREPKHVPGAFRGGSDKYFRNLHHERGEIWLPQTWWLNIDFNSLLENSPTKSKTLSIIDSGKNSVPGGHSFRLNLINKIKNQYPDVIDIFGKINGKILPERDKQEGLLEYKYYLAIENGKTDHYFSEKIVDALLCECMPIYWGCNKLEKYLPKGSFVRIDENQSMDEMVDQIISISQSNLREKNIDKIKEAKNLILHKYNIWPTIKKSIYEIHNS